MEKESNLTTRREFIVKTGMVSAGVTMGVAGMSAASYARATGANEKIRVGFIGIGNRGTQLLHLFMENPDVEVAALCDVYEPYLARDNLKIHPRYLEGLKDIYDRIPQMGETFPDKVARYTDYRNMLEDKNIDAVVIATPDHWHAIMTIEAIKAGKDVYVEKPLSKTIQEGRAMVNAQKNSKQVVTVGLNRRGGPVFPKLAGEIADGKIGKVTFANACHVRNMFPAGIGKMKPEEPPKDFDWDAWLGPCAYRPYQYNIAPYKFRWWEDFGDQLSNQGIHFLDAIRWMINEEAPTAVNAFGGKYAIDDDRTIPDTMQAMYEFKSNVLVNVSVLEASSSSFIPYGFMEIRGTKGTVYADESSYKIVPTVPGQFQRWGKKHLIEPEEYKSPVPDALLPDESHKPNVQRLIRNFLDCVKSRETPLCTLETGHRSTTLAHIATISMLTKKRLLWDSVNERFTNSEEANKLLSYEYRAPYKL